MFHPQQPRSDPPKFAFCLDTPLLVPTQRYRCLAPFRWKNFVIPDTDPALNWPRIFAALYRDRSICIADQHTVWDVYNAEQCLVVSCTPDFFASHVDTLSQWASKLPFCVSSTRGMLCVNPIPQLVVVCATHPSRLNLGDDETALLETHFCVLDEFFPHGTVLKHFPPFLDSVLTAMVPLDAN